MDVTTRNNGQRSIAVVDFKCNMVYNTSFDMEINYDTCRPKSGYDIQSHGADWQSYKHQCR